MASSAPSPSVAAGYRPDIDGLRALAVLAVIGFHVAPGRLPGGFVGVDIFFVISGYLISAIILRALEEGRFSFAAFYRRRVRRIFPALILVLAVSLAAGWLLLPDRDFERFGLHLAAGAGFLANFAAWREAGYFDVYPYAKPLLHLWSLGVEEQYYALWPLFLFLCWRLRTGFLLPFLLVAAASFALNIHQSGADPVGAFYSPLTRFWELALGGLLALRRGTALPARPAGLAATAGLFALAASLVLIESDRGFPGWWALLPTFGTFLIILAGPRAWPNRLLALRPLVWVGLISYPLYLWHWPLLAFGHAWRFDIFPFAWRLAAAALAFPLAWTTYVLVEQPIRRLPKIPVAALCAGIAALAAAGLAVWASGGVPSRRLADDPKRAFISFYRNLHADSARYEGCSFGSPSEGLRRSTLPAACTAAGPRGTWLLWGDSHARALGVGLARSLPAGIALARITSGGCPPALPETAGRTVCGHADAYALAAVARLRPDTVILTRRGGFEGQDWTGLARRIRKAGARRVVLVGPAPEWRRPLPQIVVRHDWPAVPAYVGRRLDLAVIETDRTMERRLAGSRDLDYVSLVRGLCSPQGCLARVPGTDPPLLTASDTDHLSPWGSLHVARTILVPALVRAESGAPPGR